jgi:DNA ligase (NAD+)
MAKARKPPAEPIEALAAKIRHHRNLYYNGTPEISDAEFDALEDRLRDLAPDHPVLAEVGAAPIASEEARAAEAEAEPLADEVEAFRGSPDALAKDLVAMCTAFYEAPLEDTPEYRATVKRYRFAWEMLKRLAPDHAVFGEIPPAEGKDWTKARHEIPMGSLNKVNTSEELTAWAERCDQHAETGGLEKVSTDLSTTEKLDGLSLELLYSDGRLEAAITRGDGVIGERITANVLRMHGVPGKISSKARLSVRGEIVLKKADGEKMIGWKRTVDKRFEELKSLRNMAAGLTRAKEPRYLFGVRFLSVLCYDLEGSEGLETEDDKLALIRSLGFEVPAFVTGDIAAIIRRFDEYQTKIRERLDYEIDGLVVRANKLHTGAMLGELNNRPRAAVAFKFAHEMQVTTLLDILWSTGDSGRITPIAQIAPVFLAGAEVRQASLHNVANLKKLNIGIGDQVLVSRRNDVIPYVEKVEVKGPNVAEPPEKCGVCGTKVSVEGEYLICRNLVCPARKVGRLKRWIGELGLLDWGERTLERFYEEGLVKEPADLYRLTVKDIDALEGFGEVSAKRLLEPLLEKKKLPMTTFIAALGIENVSRETAKLLVTAGYDTIDKLVHAKKEDLAEIPGLGEIKAERIVTGIESRVDEIARLKAAGVVPVALKEGGPLAGLSFCFSGAHSRPRKELETMVEKNGGSVAASVTKGLSYLVLADKDSTSSKAQKARKLGVEVIDEATFDEILAEKKASASTA